MAVANAAMAADTNADALSCRYGLWYAGPDFHALRAYSYSTMLNAGPDFHALRAYSCSTMLNAHRHSHAHTGMHPQSVR